MISCPGCGQSLRFDPKLQRLVCDYCSNTYDPEELKSGKTAAATVNYNNDEEVEAAANSDDESFEGTLFTCPQCGGEILSDNDTAITFCGFCCNCCYCAVFNRTGYPIRTSPDQFLFADPRSFSQLTTSFFALGSQGIPRSLLFSFSFRESIQLLYNCIVSFCL